MGEVLSCLPRVFPRSESMALAMPQNQNLGFLQQEGSTSLQGKNPLLLFPRFLSLPNSVIAAPAPAR